jgi:hypothetical protein
MTANILHHVHFVLHSYCIITLLMDPYTKYMTLLCLCQEYWCRMVHDFWLFNTSHVKVRYYYRNDGWIRDCQVIVYAVGCYHICGRGECLGGIQTVGQPWRVSLLAHTYPKVGAKDIIRWFVSADFRDSNPLSYSVSSSHRLCILDMSESTRELSLIFDRGGNVVSSLGFRLACRFNSSTPAIFPVADFQCEHLTTCSV